MKLLRYILNRSNSFFPFAYSIVNERESSSRCKVSIRGRIKVIERTGIIRTFKDVNVKNMDRLNTYLVNAGYKTTYIRDIMFSLSAIANRAVEKNFLLKNPVVGYKIKPGKESKHVRPLSEKSLRELESEKFDNPSLQFAADMFVFCCHTGLSYTDLVTSVYKEIETDDDGTLWLSSKRNKNQNKYIIPLDAIAMRMIEKYKNSPAELHFKKLLPEYLFPFIRRETYYQLLQKVAKMKSLPEHISPHVARHTFATIMLAKGVSIESIKKMLGHSPSSSATWLYAEVNKSKIKKEVRKTI